MFLDHVVLENIRSIRRLELPLRKPTTDTPRKWTFLLGENGTGKSTVLRAIALGLAGSEALPELLGSPADWVRRGEREGRIGLRLRTSDGAPRDISLVLRRDENIRQVFERNRELLEKLDAALEHTDRNYFTVGYGVSRHPSQDEFAISKSAQRFRHPRAEGVGTLFSPDAQLTSLESWAMDLDYRRDHGLEVVQDALSSLLPGIELLKVDRETRELIFETPDGPMPYRLLSDGYQNVAAWTGDLLSNVTRIFDDYRRPLETRGLLLIDEIGLHLHPVWQRQLMRFMNDRLPNFQIVATTHSPLAIHQADEGELYFLRRAGTKKPSELHAYYGAPRTLMLHQLLTSPIFGLTSLDSEPIEMMKDRYRDLRDLPRRDAAEEQELGRLASELEDLPDWSEGIAGQDDVKELLSEIKLALR
ncbi:MAG: AAA family ATPase [Acidobacteriota bacterium]